MSDKLHEFESGDLRVTWSKQRCIHAAECVRGLPGVFMPGRRPWITPADAPADRIAAIVMRCPTGALHFQRRDGGAPEPVPEQNTIVPSRDGPLFLRGDLEVTGPGGTVLLRDTRVALCRCGRSRNKPFCDNSHWSIAFNDDGEVFEGGVKPAEAPPPDGRLRITPTVDGPLELRGPLTVRSADGRVAFEGGRAALCRCGGSRNKPFCDASHVTRGFRSEPGG
jgi:CDGSH-type Zn-finger protein/uncharacterized Fe-S cluster protein YjdI